MDWCKIWGFVVGLGVFWRWLDGYAEWFLDL